MAVQTEAQIFRPARRPDPGPMPKNITGVVRDLRGTPLFGAVVFIRDMKNNVIRTLPVDQEGRYSIRALTPSIDYEVHAEFRGKASEKKLVSGFVDRQDNVVNFELDVAVIEGTTAEPDDAGPEFRTFDLVELHASFRLPVGVPAPIPAVLLLHGYGEDRTVWGTLRDELLTRGFAVMSLDLRGHGESKSRNGLPIQLSEDWRTKPSEFPLDLDPALDYLKAQTRLDTRRIVVIGYDVGANLALLASGRFPEVRTVVALKPNLAESHALAGSAQDFTPRSALIVVNDEAEGHRIRSGVQNPARVLTTPISGGSSAWIGDKAIQEAIFQWLTETF
jgi:pimeloyl-ACP methyl ester carboxylesterase